LFYNFDRPYEIRRVQVDQDGYKLNGTYQFLFYADDVNTLGEKVDTIKKNTEDRFQAFAVICLQKYRSFSSC
jgi:hypothetical protein